MVMSATLDVAALKGVLGVTPPLLRVMTQFSVETRYCPVEAHESLDRAALRVTKEALKREGSRDVLVILPGIAEFPSLCRL